MHQENKINLSVIIPVYNEKNFLAKLLRNLNTILMILKEVIFIDDGSTDGSTNILRKLKKKNYKFLFKLIKLDINSEKARLFKQGSKILLVSMLLKMQI